MQWYITGTICLYRRYIATSVTYIGSVASGTMPSVEACKAACDRDTISDCIGVVYQENSGKCTKFPDTSHLTKVASADSEFYERHCQFTAGISTWRLFLFKKNKKKPSCFASATSIYCPVLLWWEVLCEYRN